MLVKLTSKNQLTLPKAVLDKLPETAYFEVEAEGGRIILTPVRVSRADTVREKLAQLGINEEAAADAVQWARHPRAGWDEQFREMAERGDDQLLDAPPPADGEQAG